MNRWRRARREVAEVTEPGAPINDPHATAIHEAGHAVIGRVLGLVCGHATIVADEDSAGHHVIEDPWVILGHWEDRQKYRMVESVLRGRIMAFMAGAEAERHFFGACQGGDGDDQYQIALMAEHLDVPKVSGIWDADVERYIARLQARTVALVKRHRKAIARVGLALLSRKTLSADQIELILAGAGRA
jgi:ATP-dependent Zn protease